MKLPKPIPWDPRFNLLAVYNAEVGRGITHTPEYDKEMKTLQDEFNRTRRESWHDA